MMRRTPAEENDVLGAAGQAFSGPDPNAPPRPWQAAEARLYPLIVVDADMYEAVVTLVGEASAALREQCHSVTDLLEIDITDVAARCPATSAVTELGFDPGVAVDAARAQRWRELTQPADAAAFPAADGDQDAAAVPAAGGDE